MLKSYHAFLEKLQWLAPLLTRALLGFVILAAGRGHLEHLPALTARIDSLHMPFPQLLAYALGGLEIGVGALLLAGCLTRVAATVGVVLMAAALAIGHHRALTGLDPIAYPSAIFAIPEALAIALLFFLMVHGAGVLSIDAIAAKMAKGGGGAKKPAGDDKPEKKEKKDKK